MFSFIKYILEFGTRIRLFSWRSEKGLARKARRDAWRLYRSSNELFKLEGKEKDDREGGNAKKLKSHIKKIEKALGKELKYSLDIVRRQHSLRLRSLKHLDNHITATSKDSTLNNQLKDIFKNLKSNFNKEVTALLRLKGGQKPAVFKGIAGTDESAIIKAIRSETYQERRDINKRRKAEKDLKNATSSDDIVKRFKEVDEDISQTLKDIFLEIYYIYIHIQDQQVHIEEYVNAGFSQNDAKPLLEGLDHLNAVYFRDTMSAYENSLRLYNLISRR